MALTHYMNPPLRGLGANHRWLILGIGVAAQASFSAAFAGIPATGPLLRGEFQFSAGQLGLVLGAILLGIAISEVPWGMVTDRLGDRRTLLTGLLGTGILLAVLAVVLTPGTPAFVFAVALFLVGVLGGSVNGSSGRAVMAWFPEDRRGFAMSIRQTAIPAGGALGAALLPVLAGELGFHAVFGALALFCLTSAAAAFAWLHEPAEPAARPRGTGGSPLRSRAVWRLACASGLLSVPQFAVTTFASVFLVSQRHTHLALGTLTLLIVQLGGAAARVWSGGYTDRNGNRRGYIKAVAALGTVAFAGAAVLTEAPVGLTAAALAIGGLLASAWHGVAYTEIARMAGTERAGTTLGLENTTVFAAGFLAPVLIPVLASGVSWAAVWAGAGACCLLAILVSPGRHNSAEGK
ncbi:MFS transporter [Sciscionella sediminilitoris]|uniref:MFS transporter n=1 Tax=Sciscionella sediminilitoris TaxID=1445613 RepID=UPI00068F0F2C|nr:MFS transporter [Sciscionella sp. SE31]